LSDIRLATQELGIIKSFAAKQRLLGANLKGLFSPSSFRVTTTSRQASFKFETDKMDKIIERHYNTTVDLDRLLEKADSLAKQTQSAVAVRQEDHGKAILVFTVVTVIFLPLSFVTSYLGMNTVDIRDMESSQALFWEVSLPLTVGIIVISLLIGLKGYEIKEFFQSREW
jgi:Mg2+ and Co2+ transporter CorA